MKYVLLVCLFLFAHQNINGQTEKKIHYKYWKHYGKIWNEDIDSNEVRVNIDTALLYINSILESESYTTFYYSALNNAAFIHNYLGNYAEALRLFKKCLRSKHLVDETGERKGKDYLKAHKSRAWSGITDVFIKKGDYRRALKRLDTVNPYRESGIICSMAVDEKKSVKFNSRVVCYLGLNEIEKAYASVSHGIIYSEDTAIYPGIYTDMKLYMKIVDRKFSQTEIKEELQKAIDNIDVQYDDIVKLIEGHQRKVNPKNISYYYYSSLGYGPKTTFFDKEIIISPPYSSKERDKSNLNHFSSETSIQNYYKQLFLESKFVKELQAYL